MKELDREELLELLKTWRCDLSLFVKKTGETLSWNKESEQAYDQIKQLISQEKEDDEIHLQMIDIILDLYEQLEQSQERQVDKEWIDEKARELIMMVANLYPYEGNPCVIPKSKAKDFIRSIASEIQKPRITKKFVSKVIAEISYEIGHPEKVNKAIEMLKEAGYEVEK